MAEETFFDGLEVTFHWSETRLHDFQGNPYQEEQTLEGEKAYEFLVQLNAMDKERFNQKLLGDFGYDKTKVDIHIPTFTMNDMRIDLGDLELHGSNSISDALAFRLPMQARGLLKYPEQRKAFETTEAECKGIIEQANNAVALFRMEEDAYLEKHPEIRAINEKQPDSYYAYLVSPEALEFCKENDLIQQEYHPQHLGGFVVLPKLQKNNTMTYGGFSRDYLSNISLEQVGEYQQDLRPIGDNAIITSRLNPGNMAYQFKHLQHPMLDIAPAITPKEVEAIRYANDHVTLQHRYASFDDREADHKTIKLGEEQELHGVQAIRYFADAYINRQEDDAQPAFEPYYLCKLQLGDQKFEYAFRDEPYFMAKELNGEYLPPMDDELKKNLKKAWSVLCKYGSDYNACNVFRDIPPLYQPDERYQQPTVEQRREDLKQSSYLPSLPINTKDKKMEAAKYYMKYAACDAQNDTPEKIIKEAISKMIEDGLTKSMVKGVLKYNVEHPAYYEEIGANLLAKDETIKKAFQEQKALQK